MKKIAILLAVAVFAGCNSSSEDTTSTSAASDSARTDTLNYAYTPDYSSKFEIGDSKNAQTILTLWKTWDGGNLSAGKDLFADSVTMYFADGSMLHGSRDSILSAGQKIRDNFGKVESKVHAWVALKSTDKNENWVSIWGTETSVDKKGKTDSTELHETWRLNNDGKADLLYQYAQQSPKK